MRRCNTKNNKTLIIKTVVVKLDYNVFRLEHNNQNQQHKFKMGNDCELLSNSIDYDKTLTDDNPIVFNSKSENPLKVEPIKKFTLQTKSNVQKVPIKPKISFLNRDRELNILQTSLTREYTILAQAIKVLKDYHKETEIIDFIDKWRSISIKEMNYILNMTLLKIEKNGGYKEFIRKEIENEKNKIRYSNDDSFQETYDTYVDSPEFEQLEPYEQNEIKERMEYEIDQMNQKMETDLEKLDKKLDEASAKEFDMAELAARLQVNHEQVFGKQ